MVNFMMPNGNPSTGPPLRPVAPAETTTSACPPDTENQSRPVATCSRHNHPCPWEGCGQFFACPHNVRQHIRAKHTNERPFGCENCHSTFTRNWGLSRHMKNCHPQVVWQGRGRTPKTDQQGANAATDPEPSQQNDQSNQPVTQPQPHPPQHPTPLCATPADDLFAYGFNPTLDTIPEHPSTTPQTDGHPHPHSPLTSNMIFQPLTCASCALPFYVREDVLAHQHDAHGLPQSPLCSCACCNAVFRGSGEAMEVLARLLGEGGFDVAVEVAGEGADVDMVGVGAEVDTGDMCDGVAQGVAPGGEVGLVGAEGAEGAERAMGGAEEWTLDQPSCAGLEGLGAGELFTPVSYGGAGAAESEVEMGEDGPWGSDDGYGGDAPQGYEPITAAEVRAMLRSMGYGDEE